ncbi:toll/interleukin-1 receptor domain-containing protein [Pseudomonas sp. 21615526]|uniref:TIR domain-containing protein n=1 Tax=Pseudomonas sp. 21615526 TaxID=2738811 RepID=UPI0015BE8589|nr:TIR domain-containing protein [Pseudomonas sp. 21615526]NVZ36572.1 toll/interleukin-1 receptor domain-containing protein [Pseudomonas sp. 21615526]
MKVFVSWSGQRSKAVAELISDWIKCVLQASHPWISTRDIDKGAIWFSEISDQLKDTAAGIVCLTHENKDKPWILFETGALAKGLNTNRVCTFLIDLLPSDIEDPLAQFNHTQPDKTSMWGLICSLNGCLETQRLEEKILRQVFDTYWPQFEQKFAKALKDTPPTEVAEPRSEESILTEILKHTRSLSSRVRGIEDRFEFDKAHVSSGAFSSDAMFMSKNGVLVDTDPLIDALLASEQSPLVVVSELEKRGYPQEWIKEQLFKRGIIVSERSPSTTSLGKKGKLFS